MNNKSSMSLLLHSTKIMTTSEKIIRNMPQPVKGALGLRSDMIFTTASNSAKVFKSLIELRELIFSLKIARAPVGRHHKHIFQHIHLWSKRSITDQQIIVWSQCNPTKVLVGKQTNDKTTKRSIDRPIQRTSELAIMQPNQQTKSIHSTGSS